jgi:hypothetical protein
MTKWPRRFIALAVATALTVAVACSAPDQSMGPGQRPEPQPSTAVLDPLSSLNLLSCSTQPYAVKTQTVGTAGGTIAVGTHRLVIPAGALTSSVKITAEQMSGRVNSVRFSPEGLRFAKPAKLYLSYANCSPLLLLKRVVYTNDKLSILELLPSIDDLRTQRVSASIRHFSRYAVAW